jgi:hypothetical protein
MRNETEKGKCSPSAACSYNAPVTSIKLRCLAGVYVKRCLKLRAPIHRHNFWLSPAVLIDNDYRPTVVQACGILPLKVHFGEGDGVSEKGIKQKRIRQLQTSSDCKCVR